MINTQKAGEECTVVIEAVACSIQVCQKELLYRKESCLLLSCLLRELAE